MLTHDKNGAGSNLSRLKFSLGRNPENMYTRNRLLLLAAFARGKMFPRRELLHELF